MSTYLVYVDFQAGSGWEAVSGVIRGGVKVSEQAYNGKLKSTTNYAKVKVRGDATIVNALLTNTVKTKLKITKDGTTIFTGFVRKNFSFNIHHRPKYLEIEGVDLSILLEETKTETTFYEGKKVCDPADTANSLVHLLLDEAGVESSEIAAAITTISKTVDYFYIDARDKKTFRTVIDTILFEYGYVLYFDKTVFTLLPLFHSSLTSSHTFDDESTGAITIKKQEVEYEVVALTYYETDVEEDGICFNDTTGGDDTTDCNIELAAGEYYPEGASATDPVYSEYEQSGRTILFVKNAYLSETVGTGITVPRETMGYLAADVAFLNGAAAARYITKFKIFGDVYYQGAKHIIKIFNVAASQKIYELDLVYANNETDANSLLTGLASYLKNSTVKYSFSSPDDVAVGAIVTLDTDMLSASQVCKVIEKVQSDSSSMTDYVLIALSAYSAETIESENYHPGTVSSTQQDAINSAVTSMSDDEVVTPQEKIAYLTLWYQINGDGSTTGSYWTVKSQATALGLSTADLTAKYDALYAYLFTSPAVLGTIPGENVSITPATWQAVWAEYDSAEAEIQSAVNQSAIMPSQEDLEVYYSFDGPEVDGQTVDNSGAYIHADVEGPTQVDSAQGLAYDFDGTDDSIVTEELPEISGGLTLAAMATPDTLNDSSVGDMIISHEDEPVYLSVLDDGTVRFSFLDDSDTQRVLTYAAGWVAGARHFVEAKHDGTTARIILDGVIVASDATYALGTIPAGSWRIGAQTSSLDYPWDGVIDEVAIWSRALSYREDLGLWRVGGVQVKRFTAFGEDTTTIDGAAIKTGKVSSNAETSGSNPITEIDLDTGALKLRDSLDNMMMRLDAALARLSIGGPGVHSNLIAGFTFENSIPTLEDASLAPKRVFGETVLDYSGYGAHMTLDGPTISSNKLVFAADEDAAEFPIQATTWKTGSGFSILYKFTTPATLPGTGDGLLWCGDSTAGILLYINSVNTLFASIRSSSGNYLLCTGPTLQPSTDYVVRLRSTGNRTAGSFLMDVNGTEYSAALTGTLANVDITPKQVWLGYSPYWSSYAAVYMTVHYLYIFDAKSSSVDTAMDQIEAGTFVNLPGLQLQRASIGMTDGLGRGIAISPGAGMLALDSNGKKIHDLPSIAMSSQWGYMGHIIGINDTYWPTDTEEDTDTSTATRITQYGSVRNFDLSSVGLPPEAKAVFLLASYVLNHAAEKATTGSNSLMYLLFSRDYDGTPSGMFPYKKWRITSQVASVLCTTEGIDMVGPVPIVWYQGKPYLVWKRSAEHNYLSSSNGSVYSLLSLNVVAICV